ncbi:ParB/RepB/Spo0J family partition protein [Streptomyces cinereoruber]|uniref:ParB/RepB/Spo0J family partition protein n=1 Tax=Streptomyces cinereoruber TaxID=67260 RepID=UPI003635787F
MSIADKVGASSSFGRSRQRSERGRAKAIAEGAIPTYELVRLDLNQVSPTPLNPRRNFGTTEEKTRFGEELRQVQLAACVAVTRSAYLKLWPSHEDAIGADCQYVLVNGERRYRSALHVGVEQLDFVVRDDLASSREDFVDHLLAENLDREDFDVIERARGVQQLVDVCAEEEGERGARSRAASRLGKDRSWVTNQLALLTLPEALQTQLSSGEVSERDGRLLARHLKENPFLSAEALLEHLASVKDAASQKREEQQRLLDAGRRAQEEADSSSSLSADNDPAATPDLPDAAPADGSASEASLSADNKTAAASALPDPAPTDETTLTALLSADNKAVSQQTPAAVPPASVASSSSEPSVPAQAGASTGPSAVGGAGEDPLTSLEKLAQEATEFATVMQYLGKVYRTAATVDRERADKLIGLIQTRVDRVQRQISSDAQVL